jgi:hypothetical protein
MCAALGFEAADDIDPPWIKPDAPPATAVEIPTYLPIP